MGSLTAKRHAKNRETFGVEPIKFAEKDIFGIEQEANKLGIDSNYTLKKIIQQHIQKSKLTESTKSSVLNCIEHFNYNGRTVLKIRVPTQKSISFVGDDCYTRD
ncbi:hypothetical protein O9929_01460 [Vibrio lentus]|nr:hypothetical protein [Vibrio lentus]